MVTGGQRRRVVVGDVHGELEGLIEVLGNAELIDGDGSWTGGDGILIQTGDVVDRGPRSLESFRFLAKLQKEAVLAGGKVVRLCGNHELMLLQGYYEYANYEDPEAFADELKDEIVRGDVTASYTDGARLYTHAGLRSAVRSAIAGRARVREPRDGNDTIDLFPLSDMINGIFRDAVGNDFLERHPIFHVGADRGGDDPVGGIFWCDWTSISRSEEAYKIRQVFGHTPTGRAGVASARGLCLIDIDAGMCRFYGGERVYLEITPGGRLIQHSKDRSEWQAAALDGDL